ncbi:WD40/YVTN/BNR-like repeat-containing protein [Natranaerobius thermophilus]|uniref:Glycosyl hydrolase BNR repeat-containing protein n=1 Tax=Natranaerobius thermophilus (strain ATCC BAA-1301 / DSM 18059 / JW/NM-WN-LF) TaxID=457570 RepID=B2A4L4_NATTJ|nr:glycosyl hydrolase [Natranaerobius thermophilus]ACB85189.1 glycosyl hydrolase BNR repeat-containing protein [Natranaerobius thermophilus JW/NM-WN-LF]
MDKPSKYLFFLLVSLIITVPINTVISTTDTENEIKSYEMAKLTNGAISLYQRPFYRLITGTTNSLHKCDFSEKNIQVKDKNNEVSYTKNLEANITEQSYTIDEEEFGSVTIQNNDLEIPVEISIDESFIDSKESLDNQSKIFEIKPGDAITINNEPERIYYRSLAATVDIQMIVGGEIDINSTTEHQPVFNEIRPVQFDVMAVDRQSSKVFASRGDAIYKNKDSGDYGSWIKKATFEDKLVQSMFYTMDGSLLITTSEGNVLRSTDDGKSFETVLTDIVRWRAFDSIHQNSETGTIIFGEYPSFTGPDGEISLYKSTDDGRNWEQVLTRTGDDIRHWHSVQVDPYSGNWIATTGDLDNEIEWWESTDDGDTWEAILGADSPNEGNQDYRTLGLLFSQDQYIWGSDNPLWGYGQNFISSVDKDNPENISKDFRLPAPAYVYWQFSDIWGIGTLAEGTTMEDQNARIYTSENRGQTWQETISWPIEASKNSGGFTSVSHPNGDGYIFVRFSSELVGAHEEPYDYRTMRLKRR